MTSETELQGLSREAAGCLLELAAGSDFDSSIDTGGHVTLEVGECWLHESTEACTEIMVRVLWAAEVDLTGGPMPNGQWGAGCTGTEDFSYDSDPMLAFRIAVLRALIALKSQ